MFIKIKNLLNFILFILFRNFVKDKNIPAVPGTMMIIRLDAIGDYVLFRNFIRYVKENERYKNYKITFCGNIAWKDISECIDTPYIHDFIWIKRKKFYGNFLYKFSILKDINKRGFEIVVNPTYTREILYGDEMVWISNAQEKIGSQGVLDKHSKWKRNLFSDNYYSKLVEASNENLFEFDRNKEFFENWLNTKINIQKPFIEVNTAEPVNNLPENYITVFPGASESPKIWNIDNFVTICRFLLDNYDFNIVITGAEKEKEIAQILMSELKSERVFNLTLQTSLLQLAKVISTSELLISNESAAVHLAAAVGKRFICVSNGERLGRFHPYPKEMFNEAYYIYPEEILDNISDENFVKEAYRFSSSLSINKVNPKRVIELISNLLRKY
jgi:ADP-heptose:LPS heptosyltransferase